MTRRSPLVSATDCGEYPMTRRTLLVLSVLAMALSSAQLGLAREAERTISFAEGQWNPEQWTPLRLSLHPEV